MKMYLLSLTLLLTLSCQGQTREKNTPEAQTSENETAFPVEKTDAQWRAQLGDMAYYVLRRAGTEPQGSSDLLHNKAKGTYVCAGCGTPLFESAYKYDSGSGWPSFDREVEGNVAFSIDTSFGMQRVEEHCAVCGGHLGHVFDDGPRQTTGKRHCINGAALQFVPEQ
jgi:peptide-methionine (R)-S-oxide reductase